MCAGLYVDTMLHVYPGDAKDRRTTPRMRRSLQVLLDDAIRVIVEICFVLSTSARSRGTAATWAVDSGGFNLGPLAM